MRGIAHQCGVRANWRRINDVVVEALSSVTLAQMLAPSFPTETAASAKRIDLRLAGA